MPHARYIYRHFLQLVQLIAGLEVDELKPLRELDTENNKLKKIVCDNGTEFTSKAMFFRSQESDVHLGFIQPGKPTQNAFVESLNGKYRNECLNRHWFRTLDEARVTIDLWRDHYNHVRPHSSSNYLPPIVFAERAV